MTVIFLIGATIGTCLMAANNNVGVMITAGCAAISSLFSLIAFAVYAGQLGDLMKHLADVATGGDNSTYHGGFALQILVFVPFAPVLAVIAFVVNKGGDQGSV